MTKLLREIIDTLKFSIEHDQERRDKVSLILCYVAFIPFVVIGFKAYLAGEFVYASIHFIVVLLNCLAISFSKTYSSGFPLKLQINIVYTTFFAVLIFTGGYSGDTGIIWALVFPLISFTVNSLPVGVIMTSLYLILSSIGMYLTELPFVINTFNESMVDNYFAALIFVIVMTVMMEYVRITGLMREKAYKDQLIEKSQIDELTGVYNRSFMDQTIEKLFSRTFDFALVFADIDHFKSINDTYGHHIGDEVIRKVSLMIKERLRIDDVVARWGGEEFVMLLRFLNSKDATEVLERIRKDIENYDFYTDKNEKFNITVSFGVAHSSDYKTYEDLLKAADDLLYRSKNTGRNKISYE